MAGKRGKKEPPKNEIDPLKSGVHIIGAGEVVEQPITDTIETNYFPYAMSVIMSRAIPEIDGFKPSHRKILYTMYKMGLLTGARSKSANIVGRTMQLNPHATPPYMKLWSDFRAAMKRCCTRMSIQRVTSVRRIRAI